MRLFIQVRRTFLRPSLNQIRGIKMEKKGPLGLFESASVHNFKDAKFNHLFEESSALNVYDKKILNLAAGCPGPDLLKPVGKMMEKAVEHRMKAEIQNNYYLFQYGPTAGLWGMRQELAKFLTKEYGNEVQREDLILTCGATHGIHLCASMLLVPNGVIFVDEYSYMIALSVFKEFPNFKVVEVPSMSDGVDLNKFRCIAEDIKNKSDWNVSEDKPFWALFYTVPTFHNPTGILLPPNKCKALVQLARDLDILVLCDDVYNLLYYTDEPYPPARLFSYDKPDSENYKGGHIISNCTFSKILAPGTRVGWMEVPCRLAIKFRKSGIMQSGGSVNNVMFGFIQSLLELGLIEENLHALRKIYKERMIRTCAKLKEHLPKECKFLPPVGGYFIWIEMPVDVDHFLSWCLKNGGPGAIPASRFKWAALCQDQGNKSNEIHSHAARFSIAFHDVKTLEGAIEDMCNKLKQYMKNKSNL